MLIHYATSGGFANLRLSYTADTAKLSQELAQELERLANQAEFFSLQEQPAIAAAGVPDMVQYDISIEQDGQRRSLRYNEMTVPDSLRPLLERLQELALEQQSNP